MAVTGQGTASAGSLDGDGFVAAKQLKTTYFTVSIAPGVDEGRLVQNLDIRMMPDNASSSVLGDMLDGFYEWASNVLDMRVPGYHGDIKVVRDARQLQAIYRCLYGTSTQEQTGFYIYDINTLYIVASDFTKEVMGHELGHVVVSNYFVVQPSTKAAEVLAGYIEFELRKRMLVRRQMDDGRS
ncbi:MAG: hypothetical protein HGA80_01515 [Candidatus Omnitrophica bacterium]|nr:hypothetical protein [Candidatus Omnitrophota bacterium]